MIDDLIQEIKGIPSGPRELKKFGILFLVVLGAIGAWLLYSQGAGSWLPWAFLALAALFGLAGFLRPALLAGIYKAWMTLAAVLGFFISRIILSLVFYGMITPLGVIARLFGKDWLDMKMGDRQSYWHMREDDQYQPAQSEKMY